MARNPLLWLRAYNGALVPTVAVKSAPCAWLRIRVNHSPKCMLFCTFLWGVAGCPRSVLVEALPTSARPQFVSGHGLLKRGRGSVNARLMQTTQQLRGGFSPKEEEGAANDEAAGADLDLVAHEQSEEAISVRGPIESRGRVEFATEARITEGSGVLLIDVKGRSHMVRTRIGGRYQVLVPLSIPIFLPPPSSSLLLPPTSLLPPPDSLARRPTPRIWLCWASLGTGWWTTSTSWQQASGAACARTPAPSSSSTASPSKTTSESCSVLPRSPSPPAPPAFFPQPFPALAVPCTAALIERGAVLTWHSQANLPQRRGSDRDDARPPPWAAGARGWHRRRRALPLPLPVLIYPSLYRSRY